MRRLITAIAGSRKLKPGAQNESGEQAAVCLRGSSVLCVRPVATRRGIGMKRIFLSALIGVGMVAAIFQILSRSEAARTSESYPLVCRGAATFKTDAPTPPCEGCINAGDVP